MGPLLRVSMSLPGVVEPECLDTLLGPFSSFMSLSNLISCREFFFLSCLGSAFSQTVATIPCCLPPAGPKTGAAKHAAPFGLKTLKVFNMHSNTPFRVQLWAAMYFKPPCFAIVNLWGVHVNLDINGNLTGLWLQLWTISSKEVHVASSVGWVLLYLLAVRTISQREKTYNYLILFIL